MNKYIVNNTVNSRRSLYKTKGGMFDLFDYDSNVEAITDMVTNKLGRLITVDIGSDIFYDSLCDIDGYLTCFLRYNKSRFAKEKFKDVFRGYTDFYPFVNLDNFEMVTQYLLNKIKNGNGKIIYCHIKKAAFGLLMIAIYDKSFHRLNDQREVYVDICTRDNKKAIQNLIEIQKLLYTTTKKK